MAKGLNMQSVKNENRQLILYLLNSDGELSRKELARRLALTPAAVTKICAELIEDGYVEESGELHESGRSGRKEILLSLRLSDKYVFGVNAESDIITFSLSSLDGALIESGRISFLEDIDEVLDKAAEFLDGLKVYGDKIIGTGVCIIGSQDENDFGIWKVKELKDKFEKRLNLPCVIENNVKAFAESELIYGGSAENESVLFLKWGPGVGSAIVANGKVFSGDDSSVAEIGHYIVNAGGAKCRCGRFGCLETEVNENIIENELGENKSVSEQLKNPSENVINILDHKINLVALALTNTATILNTQRIVLFGTMFNNEIIADRLSRQCLRYNLNMGKNTVKLSSLNKKSSYIGCCAICAKRFFFERSM